jgi:hypothetical protein
MRYIGEILRGELSDESIRKRLGRVKLVEEWRDLNARCPGYHDILITPRSEGGLLAGRDGSERKLAYPTKCK